MSKVMVKIGKGTLADFAEDHTNIQMTEGLEVVYTQFPATTGTIGVDPKEFSEVYEYVIGYKDKTNGKNTIKKEIKLAL